MDRQINDQLMITGEVIYYLTLEDRLEGLKANQCCFAGPGRQPERSFIVEDLNRTDKEIALLLKKNRFLKSEQAILFSRDHKKKRRDRMGI